MSIYDDERPDIPTNIEREIKVEAGHNCSVTGCLEHTYLEIHHINENRNDNRKENLILLCDKHHKMAHRGVIDRKALRAYKEKLARNDALGSFVQGTERDRVRKFLDSVSKVFSYNDYGEISWAGSETGYRFEEEVYENLIDFCGNLSFYQLDLRSHDQVARNNQDRIVDLIQQILSIRENGNYRYNGSYCSRFIPRAKPGTPQYDQEIDSQKKIVYDRLYEIQGLCSELWDYVERR
ncbi:HNH endonuclease [Vibrio parahaemolyticus]|nr:HNH endonuclease [Vibrio parahaemolyticus]